MQLNYNMRDYAFSVRLYKIHKASTEDRTDTPL